MEPATHHQPKIFLHLTKTAGGTLKTALEQAQGLDVRFLYNTHDKEALKSSGVSSVDMIYGHTYYGVHNELSLPDARYLCVLRHPVLRTISHYYHLKHVDQGRVGDKIREVDTIDAFFAQREHWEFSNLMARVISGFMDRKIGPEDEVDLFETAKRNIDDGFDFVGCQEYFEISLRRLSKQVGVAIDIPKSVNVGRYDFDDIAEDTLTRIEDLNKVDMKLYKYCLETFL